MRIVSMLAVVGATAAHGEETGWTRRLWGAAHAAAVTPATWAPLAAAALAAPFDAELRDWAQEHPVFGDAAQADRTSDDLARGLLVVAGAAAIASPAPPETVWFRHKGLTALAFGVNRHGTRRATRFLKAAADRERPDGSDTRSFPSGHSSGAFAMASFADHELRRFGFSEPWQAAASTGLYGTAALTAWARVEADRHWASDVLAGAALGNFLARFLHAAVLGPDSPVAVIPGPEPGGAWSVRVAWTLD